MAHDSWTHRLARAAVRPLLGTRVTPNHLTTARDWAIAMGMAAAGGVTAASLWSERLERSRADGVKAYEGRGGFDFDDILYLFGPVAWLDALWPLLLGATIGGPVFAAVTLWRLRRTGTSAARS
jgi:hypothetical protein